MRIVAGRHKGRRLRAPAGPGTRPTADRVREALFSILGPMDGRRVLDLYAGSGALGIEALSRGAESATCVESARPALAAIRANLDAAGEEAEVVARNSWPARPVAPTTATRVLPLVLAMGAHEITQPRRRSSA